MTNLNPSNNPREVPFSNSLPHHTRPVMTDCPKRSAVINQEATDKLLDNKKHHTSAQIQQVKQVAAITSAVFEAKKVNVAAQQKQCVAAFEDQLRKEDQQNEKNMARPDLLMVPTHHVVTALSHFLIVSLNPNADRVGKTEHEAT